MPLSRIAILTLCDSVSRSFSIRLRASVCQSNHASAAIFLNDVKLY